MNVGYQSAHFVLGVNWHGFAVLEIVEDFFTKFSCDLYLLIKVALSNAAIGTVAGSRLVRIMSRVHWTNATFYAGLRPYLSLNGGQLSV